MSAKKQPKILIYVERAGDVHVQSLIASLNAKEIEYCLLLSNADDIKHFEANHSSASFEVLKMPMCRKGSGFWSNLSCKLSHALALIAYYRKLKRFFQMYPFEVVHAIGAGTRLFSVLLKIRFDVAQVWQLQGGLPTGASLLIFRRLVALFCDRLLVFDSALAHPLGRSRAWKGKVVVFRQGYEATEYANAVSGTYQELEAEGKKAA